MTLMSVGRIESAGPTPAPPGLGTTGYTKMWTRAQGDPDYIARCNPYGMEPYEGYGVAFSSNQNYSASVSDVFGLFDPELGTLTWEVTYASDRYICVGPQVAAQPSWLVSAGVFPGVTDDRGRIFDISGGVPGSALYQSVNMSGSQFPLQTLLTQDAAKSWVFDDSVIGRWTLATGAWDFQVSGGSLRRGCGPQRENLDGSVSYVAVSLPATFRRMDASGTLVVNRTLEVGDASTSFAVAVGGTTQGARSVFVDVANNYAYVICTRHAGSLSAGLYVLRVDADTGDNGMIVADLTGDGIATGASGGSVALRRAAVDGSWWVAVQAGAAWDVVRYQSDWTHVHTLSVDFPALDAWTEHTNAADHLVGDLLVVDDILVLASFDSDFAGGQARISGYRIV